MPNIGTSAAGAPAPRPSQAPDRRRPRSGVGRILAPLLAAIGLLLHAPATLAQGVDLRLYPTQPLIERTRLGQALNFDFEITNTGVHALELTAIRAAVRGPQGRIVQRLEVNDNGGSPGINTIPNRVVKPGEAQTIFNPFHTLARDVPIGRMEFEFVFADGPNESVTERLVVRPVRYLQKTQLTLPLGGRLLVWDGHDFYGHHRRWNFSTPTMKKLGVVTNPGRYALDLVVADADGRFHSGDGSRREDYFGYGASVLAPADGKVVAMANTSSNEPSEPTTAQFVKEPMFAVYGNYVVIDHGNGEFSQLGHMKQGSVRVRVGERVRRGQVIGEVGASGTSAFPHLHYQLVTRPSVDGDGLPPRFDRLWRVLGAKRRLENDASIDSGDIVQTHP